MMLIVGVHFFPLASLFRVKRYQIAGVLLCLLALVTLFFVPEQFYLGNFKITARWVILGFGGAFILWFIGFANWLQGRELFAQSKS